MLGLYAIDILVGLVVLASAANGIRKGFTTEAMKLVAWAGAIFITVVAKPAVSALTQTMISVEIIAEIVAMAVTFVVTIVALNFLGKYIGERIKASFMGPIDRTLGAVFGLVRGLIVVSAAFWLYTQFVAEKDYPYWVEDAKALPYLKIGAIVISEVTPDLFGDSDGYADEAREELDDLVDEVGDGG